VTSSKNQRGTLMLNLYRDVYQFAACLRAADYASATKAEMVFVCDLRYRHMREDSKMRLTTKEWQRLTMLAIRGGWDGTALEEEDQAYA